NIIERIYELNDEQTITLQIPKDFKSKVVKVIVLPVAQPRPKKDRLPMKEMLAGFRELYKEEPGEIEIPERFDRPNLTLENADEFSL
ncbi:MAG: hypothetical protein D6675_07175, partial [Gemmatimonadetes bacterium]